MKNLRVKAENALKTIGEAALELEVPTHVLRFWETKFSNIKPVKYNNRRYYNAANIEVLKKIKELLYGQNYSIAAATAFFKKKIIASKDHIIKMDLSILIQTKARLLKAKNKLNAILQK
jgi:DNA-binding transcriptional MerR regulator